MKLRVGTRGSRLALIQTEMICSAIKAVRPDIEPEIKIVTTDGDKILDRPIAEIGGKGVFVDNIETMLLNREIDIAVHSGKDIPSIISDDFSLKAIVPRADDRDFLLMRSDTAPKLGKEKLVIGTSSPRRAELLKRLYPGCEDKLLRGNVPTRVEKLRRGEYDGIILAAAGLERLGLDVEDLQIISLDTGTFIPATNQGIIVCEAVKGSEGAGLLNILADTEPLKRLNLIMSLERRLSSYMDADCYDAAAVNVKLTEEDRFSVKWFYGKASICEEIISLEEAEQIINGTDEVWKRKLQEYVL